MIARRAWLIQVGALTTAWWTLAVAGAQAQPDRRRRILVLLVGEPQLWADFRGELPQAMASYGWFENKNLEITWRFASDNNQLIALAREITNSDAHAIVTRGTPATLALQRASRTAPIVTGVGDPVASGFARSLAVPGANITGLSWATVESTAKQLELLREIVPHLRRVVMFLSPRAGPALQEIKGPMERAVGAASLDFLVHLVSSSREFVAALRDHGTGATTAAYTSGLPDIEPRQVVDALREARWPSVFDHRGYVDAGGLMSYRLDWDNQMDRTAAQIDKVLRGMSPAQIPFEQPTRTQLVINTSTASILGLTIPTMLRLRADELVS